MITRQNLHMHSTWDDGHDPCAVMLDACQRAGFTSAGISLHSPMPFITDWAPESAMIPAFVHELAGLRERFAPALRVLTGIEWDVLSDPSQLDVFDYVIGSAHHFPVTDIPPGVDGAPEETYAAVQTYFGGDGDAAAECYFGELAKVAAEPHVMICGHFDLLLKFNDHLHIFNPESPRYLAAAEKALNALLDAGKIFEVNTGAISRGWRSVPYPERRWLLEIARKGGRVTISSDAHRPEHVATQFEETEKLLRDCGFTCIQELAPDGTFVPVSLIE